MNIQDEIRAELRKIHSLLLTSGSFRSEDSEDCPDQDRTASGAGNGLTAVESVWRRVSIAALQRAFPGRARSSAPASEAKMTAVESMWRRVSTAALKRAISGRAGSSSPVSEAKVTACAAPEAGRNSNGDMSESLAGKAALHLESFNADGPDPGRVTSQSCTADAANMLIGKHGCNVSESEKEDNLAVIEEGGSCVQSTVDIGCRCSSVFTSFNIPPCNSEIKPTDNWPEGPAVQMPPSQDTLDGQGRSTADPTIARKEDIGTAVETLAVASQAQLADDQKERTTASLFDVLEPQVQRSPSPFSSPEPSQISSPLSSQDSSLLQPAVELAAAAARSAILAETRRDADSSCSSPSSLQQSPLLSWKHPIQSSPKLSPAPMAMTGAAAAMASTMATSLGEPEASVTYCDKQGHFQICSSINTSTNLENCSSPGRSSALVVCGMDADNCQYNCYCGKCFINSRHRLQE